MKRAVFLDLNGTIVLPVKPESLSELTLIPGADLAVAQLLNAGFVCPVITVQSRISKGFFSESEFRTWFSDFFSSHGLRLSGPYVCPHRFGEPCDCEKPKPMLYEQAMHDLDIDVTKSFVVGDSASDMHAAKGIEATGCFVRTGWGQKESELKLAQSHASFVGADILEVAKWIVPQ